MQNRTPLSEFFTQPYDPDVVHVPAPQRRRPSRLRRLVRFGLYLLAVGLFLSVVVAGTTVAFFSFAWGDRILPGVQVLGVPLSGYTPAEATAALEQNWATRPVYVHDQHQSVAVSPAELGLALDANATVQAALRIGRPAYLSETLDALRARGQVNPVWYFDPTAAEAKLGELAAHFEAAPVNAGVQFADGRLVVTPAGPGRRIDVAATTQWLQQNAAWAVKNGQLPLATLEVPPAVSAAQAETLVAQAHERLVTNLVLLLFDPLTNERLTWEIPPAVWVSWLALDANGAEVVWKIDEAQIAAQIAAQIEQYTATQALGADRYLDAEQAAAAILARVRAKLNGAHTALDSLRIYHRDRQHVVQAGETFSSIAYAYGLPYPWLQQANPGVDSLSAGQTITIPSRDAFLPLPVVENKRILIDLSDQKMRAYENDALKWEWPVSTGIASSPTAPGVYQIQTHEENAYAGNWDLWMPNFMGIYRPVPTSDFMNGFHGFPTRNGYNLLWTNSLGTPVTYGCILVGNDNMAQLYTWGEEGVVVEIRP